MTAEEKIEGVVQELKNKVMFGKYDMEVISELGWVDDYLNPKKSTRMTTCVVKKDDIPTFASLSRPEMRKVLSMLKKQLVQELDKKETSYLQTMRIVEALHQFTGEFPKPKKPNNKLKFCVGIWKESIPNELELVSLLDES